MNAINVKRDSAASWAVGIDGQYKGNVHKFTRRGRVLFCHDLLVQRGANFPSLDKAVSDLAKRAAA